MKTPAVLRPAEPTHPSASSTLLCILDQPRVTLQLGFGLHLIIVLKILFASQVCIDTYDILNRTFVLGDTVCQERNHWSTITLAFFWLLLHVILFFDVKFPSIITNRVRLVTPHMN